MLEYGAHIKRGTPLVVLVHKSINIMKNLVKGSILVALLALGLSSCIVAGPGYYRPHHHHHYHGYYR